MPWKHEGIENYKPVRSFHSSGTYTLENIFTFTSLWRGTVHMSRGSRHDAITNKERLFYHWCSVEPLGAQQFRRQSSRIWSQPSRSRQSGWSNPVGPPHLIPSPSEPHSSEAMPTDPLPPFHEEAHVRGRDLPSPLHHAPWLANILQDLAWCQFPGRPFLTHEPGRRTHHILSLHLPVNLSHCNITPSFQAGVS